MHKVALVFGAGIILALLALAVGAADGVEKRKIEFLIASVENMPEAKFVRNGSEYTGKEAARHLRKKMGIAGSKVRSAEDFIRFCASRSLVSGTPYLIRWPDGRQMSAEEFFQKRLKEYGADLPPATR